jgi:uncharacterized protein
MQLTDSQRLIPRTRPARGALGYQRWNRLLFLHWRVQPSLIQQSLPAGLTVDTYDGSAYIGIVPFFMERIRPAYLPPLPWLSWFLELNVRTYVHDATGRPGVYFYSLDCNQPLAVKLARRFFHLPYYHAQMRSRVDRQRIRYVSERHHSGLSSTYDWQDDGPTASAEPGSETFFLVERYWLFTERPDGKLVAGQVHHAPYQVGPAEVEMWCAQPARLAGFSELQDMLPPLRARAVDVSIYPIGLV